MENQIENSKSNKGRDDENNNNNNNNSVVDLVDDDSPAPQKRKFTSVLDLCDSSEDEIVEVEDGKQEYQKEQQQRGTGQLQVKRRKRNRMNNHTVATTSIPATRQPIQVTAQYQQQQQQLQLPYGMAMGLSDQNQYQQQALQHSLISSMMSAAAASAMHPSHSMLLPTQTSVMHPSHSIHPPTQLNEGYDDEQKGIEQAIANSNRDIRDQQDAEYYESLHKDREKARKQEKLELEKKEQAELKKAIEESIVAEGKRKKEEALARLLPEPELEETNTADPSKGKKQPAEKVQGQKQHEGTGTAEKAVASGGTSSKGGTVVTVAFKLPRSCAKARVTRRFQQDCTADQLYLFLETLDELTNKQWNLRQVTPPRIIQRSETLQELGLSPRGLVVVQESEE